MSVRRFPLSAVVLGLLVACGDSDDALPDGGAGPDVGETCLSPSQVCGGACVNVLTNVAHCGGCEQPCGPSAFCDRGECSALCNAPLSACGEVCVDFSIDRDHCGNCTTVCAPEQECRGGNCACPSGTSECMGVCTDYDTDRNNCGFCGRGCAADEFCNMGSCECTGGTRESDCNDGADNDCDTLEDCDDPDCEGATRPCMGTCGPGAETCGANQMWGACEGGNGEMEICGDGIDQDCDQSDLRSPDVWEPNDTCATCKLISTETDPNVFLNARFDSVDDSVDCFKFNADDGAGYQEVIQLQLENIPSGHDYDLYLYRDQQDCESRTPLASSVLVGNADESIEWGERFAAGDSGTYFIRVVRFAGYSCTDDYKLTVNGLR